MKLNFDSFPLDVYDQPSSRALLKSVSDYLPNHKLCGSNLGKALLSSIVKKITGLSMAVTFDSLAIWYYGAKARSCLATLIRTQSDRVKIEASSLTEEAQANLMITSCIMEYLSNLESSSFANGVVNTWKAIAGLCHGKDPRNTIWDAAVELTEKYYAIAQIYHVAFLLSAYHANPTIEDVAIDLIAEALNKDSEGEESFASKQRPCLFSNVQYKSLEDNLTHRLGLISEGRWMDKKMYEPFDIYDPFIKSREDSNAEHFDSLRH